MIFSDLLSLYFQTDFASVLVKEAIVQTWRSINFYSKQIEY